MLDPTTGRWLTNDPEGFQAGDMNLYRYVGNNPTNRIDPTGLVSWRISNFKDPDKRIYKNVKTPDGQTGTVYVYMNADFQLVDDKGKALPGHNSVEKGIVIRYEGKNARNVSFIQFGQTRCDLFYKEENTTGKPEFLAGEITFRTGKSKLTTSLENPIWTVDVGNRPINDVESPYYRESGGPGWLDDDDVVMADHPTTSKKVCGQAIKESNYNYDLYSSITGRDEFVTYLVMDGKAFFRVEWNGMATWNKSKGTTFRGYSAIEPLGVVPQDDPKYLKEIDEFAKLIRDTPFEDGKPSRFGDKKWLTK